MFWSVKHLIFLGFLLKLLIASAQSTGLPDFVGGYLFDREKKEPIAFATIQVKGWAKGVVTNRNGSFKIPIRFSQLNDTLVASSMGYDTKTFLFSDLVVRDLNVIFLNPHVYGLEETTVYGKKKTKLSAKAIVRKAIRAIPKNFPNHPFGLTGYYRDYQWHKNEYLNLNEAVIQICDQGFDENDEETTQYVLHKVLINDNFPRDSVSSISYDYENGRKTINKAYLDHYGGNELRILRIHDAIRNYDVSTYAFVYKLKSQLLLSHSFQREKDVYLDELPFYNISFTKSKYDYTSKGILLIDKEDFSIYKMSYTLFYSDPNAEMKLRNSKKGEELIFEVISEYRPVQDGMYLNYITFNNNFRLPLPPRFFVDNLAIEFDKQRLVLKFNNPIEAKSALDISNYTLEYFGNPLAIENVILDSSDSSTVLIFPQFRDKKEKMDFYAYFYKNRKNKEAGKRLFCQLGAIEDIEGNLVNKVYDFKEYQQFREFFPQEIQTRLQQESDPFFMDKNQPVFGQQPVVPSRGFEEFWMNTPLRETMEFQ